MIIISYGTADGIFDVYADRLKRSCTEHSLRADIQVVAPFAQRVLARRHKPTFIRQMLEKHKEPVVWIDADAVVNLPFTLPAGEWDVGLLQNNIRGRRKTYPVASFVMAFRPSDASMSFLQTWDYLCQWENVPLGDHHRLHPTRLLHHSLFREVDISTHLKGSITRDLGRPKEAAIEGNATWLARRLYKEARTLSAVRRWWRQKVL